MSFDKLNRSMVLDHKTRYNIKSIIGTNIYVLKRDNEEYKKSFGHDCETYMKMIKEAELTLASFNNAEDKGEWEDD